MKNRIKELRKSNGLTLLQLSELLHVSESTVQRYESGNIKNLKYETMEELSKIFGCSPAYVMGWDDNKYGTNPSKGRRIPVYGRVAAGIPINACENILDYEEIPASWTDDYIGLKVKGNSMEPKISDGDVLIVRVQDWADSGDIVIAMINGDEATVKKLIKHPDCIVLQPFNPSYEPMYFTNAQIDTLPVKIFGKVVENRAKF